MAEDEIIDKQTPFGRSTNDPSIPKAPTRAEVAADPQLYALEGPRGSFDPTCYIVPGGQTIENFGGDPSQGDFSTWGKWFAAQPEPAMKWMTQQLDGHELQLSKFTREQAIRCGAKPEGDAPKNVLPKV